jgi:hypothetical protein
MNPILNPMCWRPSVARLVLGALAAAAFAVGYAVGQAIPVA